jgi:CHAT domain-containing protein
MTRFWLGAVTAMVLLLPPALLAAQPEIGRLLANADAFLEAEDVAQARPLYERALEAARESASEPEIGRALFGLSRVARGERRFADARTLTIDALAIFERLGDQSRIAAAALQVARLTDDNDLSRRMNERAASAARAAGEIEREADALHGLGDDLFNAGRYEESMQALLRAAAAYEGANAPMDVGTVYNSIGRVYRAHGRLDEALKYQKAALELHRKGDDLFALVQSLNAVAVVYQRQNNLNEARLYLQEALDRSAALPVAGRGPQAQDFLRANMASLLADLGQFEPAAAALEQVIAGGRDAFPAIRQTQLSAMYIGMGRGADGLKAAERAVALCGDSKVVCIDALNARSDASAAIGDRDAALRDLSLTLNGIDELRAQLVPSDFFKQDFVRYYENAYGSAISRQLDAGLEREAMETAERARSRAFLDLLASRSIEPAPPSAPALPLTLRGSPKSSGVASTTTTAAASSGDLIRTAARLKSTLLLYWVGGTETNIWVVGPGGTVHARRVPVTRQRLMALVRSTSPFEDSKGAVSAAAPLTLRESSAAWRELHALLIAPVRELLPKTNGALLTIVPHDTLANLSFAALRNASGRYLIEDYTLHYAPAGALFQFTANLARSKPAAGAVLMVSDPAPARRSSLDTALPRLPGARLEAAAITRELRASQVLSLTGGTATESSVRHQAPARSILHFAAHTVIRDDDPFASYLALAPSSDAADGDGVLTAQDVYQLKLRSDLVVLSGCRSASGTIGGDGVATFARAFLYAGAASLIASVWEVADEPSNRLMPAYYRAWLGGASKAAALRQAQLELLNDLRRGRVSVTTAIGPVPVPEHPVFWAGYSLFGEPD